MTKTCIVIAGPTASGKTDLAIKVAQHFNTEIISADSRQCYRELNVGVAKPSAKDLLLVKHHFINSHSINDDFSAAEYEHYALNIVDTIFEKNDVAVMVGGTGLYIKAFTEGLDAIPKVEEEIRAGIMQSYTAFGIGWLQQEIANADPVFCATGEIHNPHRLIRALEVFLSTGKSITTFQSRQKKQRNFTTLKYCTELPREILYKNINTRVDKMVAEGLVKEVEELISYKQLNALQTVGYRELFDYFDGKISLPEAIELIKQHSRQYAKRQMTWFKRDGSFTLIDPQNAEQIIGAIKI